MKKKRKPARLNAEIVAENGGRLAAEIAKFLLANATYMKHTLDVRRREAELRHVLGDDAWQLFLTLESTMNARSSDAMDALTIRGFEEGLRCGGKSRKKHDR